MSNKDTDSQESTQVDGDAQSESDVKGVAPSDAERGTGGGAPAAGQGRGGQASKVKSSQKRTKTGCLTCRRRRIKCGEERPTCSNCLKSKRQCEGYNQRVIFKDPLNNFRPGGPSTFADAGGATSFYQNNAFYGVPQSLPFDHAAGTSSTSSNTPLTRILPRPPEHFQYHQPPRFAPSTGGDGHPGAQSPYGVPPTDAPIAYGYPQIDLPPRLQQFYQSQPDTPAVSQDTTQPSVEHASQQGENNLHTFEATQRSPFEQAPSSQPDFAQPEGDPLATSDTVNHDYQTPFWLPQTPSNTYFPQAAPQPSPSYQSTFSNTLQGSANSLADLYQNPWNSDAVPAPSNGAQESQWSPMSHANGRMTEAELHQPVPVPNAAAFRYLQTDTDLMDDEDDPFDVDSDNDMDLDATLGGDDASGQGPSAMARDDLRLVAALETSQSDRSIRSFRTYLNEPNFLDGYMPLATDTPLLDSKTARIFCHFITVTGPSLSMYERHPPNPSVMFRHGPVPKSQQSQWTYTLPTLALQSPPLLQAMLALGSLHIAKLQGTSSIPSLKHYHRALRRVARCVSLPSKRGHIATLAATLLLGFWEVMAADHTKWNSHLLGARQLLIEYDFADWTRRIKRRNAQKDGDVPHHPHEEMYAQILHKHMRSAHTNQKREEIYSGVDKEVDEDLVSLLMGRQLSYDDHGRVTEDAAGNVEQEQELTQKDLEDYETRSDLFWWLLKQDLFQSILSGNRLLLEYDRWSHCPPRAAIGKLEAPQGTFDHLILVMGRIADFAVRDQKRKRKVVEANGGVWRPPPGMEMPPPQRTPPTAPPGVPTGAPPQGMNSAQMPQMLGMIPPRGPSRMPQEFNGNDGSSPSSSASEEIELDTATNEAENEWTRINAALQMFEECLGPNYRPLPPEAMQPLSTPFGPAIFYKTYSISCVWAMYYAGLIILQRVHPSMPAPAMVAAGIAAPKTGRWANEIGRIAAALVPIHSTREIPPSLGAALIEITIPLFFAGVQYRDPAQRGWLISKLRDITRLTGWESSSAVAAGCETSWEKQAAMGRGPAYTRVLDPIHRDDRMAGRKPYTTDERPRDSNDRRFIGVNPAARVHWAIGILGVDEDIRNLKLHDEDEDEEEGGPRSGDGGRRE
ncbi:MAG: hypothetical protein M4579_001227 [Chaenotheca gracillima]|nr:MAG: hypothetical protein M4579_001227 [Chaenotheca gracillima]